MRSIPAATRLLLEKTDGDHRLIVLMELRHPQVGETIRLANSYVDVTHRGESYIGFPFSLEFPDAPGSSGKGTVTVQNVDRRIGQMLLALRSPPMIELMVISNNEPDVRLIHVRKLWLRGIRGDEMTVTADIDAWDFATEPWPSVRVVESRYRAVFY